MFRYKSLWLTIILWILFFIYPCFSKLIASQIGATWTVDIYIVILYLSCAAAFNLFNIAYWHINEKVMTRKGADKKFGELNLYAWTGILQPIEGKRKEIVESGSDQNATQDVKANEDVLGNISRLKEKIRNYFEEDNERMRAFKAYLNVEEKDMTTSVLQTFIVGMLSSIFVFLVVNDRIRLIIDQFIPEEVINKINNSSLFYNASGALFLFGLLLMVVTTIINNTSKNRVRVFQEVTDMCIKDLEKELEEKAKAKARLEAETKAKAEEKARLGAETKAKAEEKARLEAETKAKAEEKARLEAETKAKAEEKARLEAEARVKAETEARLEAEARVKVESEARAKAELKEKRWNQTRRQRCKHLRFQRISKRSK
ncbi:hypothetical protein ACS4JF_26380 [Bacillus thuringiensis]|uniref:hypothetical protein n=1 Tax=Bacillus thuringiensis TaxID=1428 RepID=UPI0025A5DCA0|nr:hypothetical protein [Bacillus thuringiensis]MDM8361541.1 hypothetical protein [Bacillus thuringiensis]